MPIRFPARLGFLLAGCTLLLSCSDAATGPAGGLALVGSVPSRANPGWPLKDPVVVRLTDEDGEPRAGVPVTWLITEGGGSIEPVAAETDSDGRASAVWTLGAESGQNGLVVGIAEGSTVTAEVTAEAFRVDRLASSSRMACGLVDGAIWCWGDDAWIGTEHVSVPPDPFGWTSALDAPGRVEGPSDFVDLAVSGATVCGLDEAGAVLCASSTALAGIEGLPPMSFIAGAASGVGDFCGLTTAESTVWCWSSVSAPAALAGSPAFTTIAMDRGGTTHLACGLAADGSAWCWGSGSLGNGTFDPSDTPVAVAGGHQFAELAVNDNAGCGRKAGGEVWCWGRNNFGQLGVDGPDAATPARSTSGADRIAASELIVLALKGDVVESWGGANIDLPTGPVASLAGLDVAALSKNSVACVSLTDGQVYCYEWLWDRSSAGVFESNQYHPVHPVVVP